MEVTMRTAAAAIVITAILAGVQPVAQQRRQQEIDLQAAIRTETVDGDLTKAIRQYQVIAAKYTSDRALVATVLVHMADCYQKLGDPEAPRIFERIVREYADQKEASAIARARLASPVVAKPANPATRRVWTMPTRGEIFAAHQHRWPWVSVARGSVRRGSELFAGWDAGGLYLVRRQEGPL